MRKIICYILFLNFVLMFVGCSNNTDAPVFDKYKAVLKPDSIIATYNKTTDKVKITWIVKDTTGITDFVISVSDSSLFDKGIVKEITRNDTTKAGWIMPYSYTWNPDTFKSVRDSVRIFYFAVSAIYNTDKLNNFIGPRSDPDSALVRK